MDPQEGSTTNLEEVDLLELHLIWRDGVPEVVHDWGNAQQEQHLRDEGFQDLARCR
jgi:hypothetical protein